MFDLMQYALIFFDFQLILARMGITVEGLPQTLLEVFTRALETVAH